jgi:DNA-binding response OmpR family regulator
VTDKAHVLVVEDEEDLASLVEVNLHLSGYEVTTAGDGGEALEAVAQSRPDLILLDVMMPVLDGWQVLRRLKEDEEFADIPVVMLTALSEERDIIRGHLQGAVRYLTKPFEMKVLLRTVEEGLQEPDEAEIAVRRDRIRALLQRLAELDSGRPAGGAGQVSLSRLEKLPPRADPDPPEPTSEERQRLSSLTERQRYVAEELARGRSARELAKELDVSRSNIYATRKRIARKLGVVPDEVSDEVRRLND